MVGQEVLEVGEGQRAEEAVPVRPRSPEVRESGSQVADLLQEGRVVAELLEDVETRSISIRLKVVASVGPY